MQTVILKKHTNYKGQSLYPESVISLPDNIAQRWKRFGIAAFISEGQIEEKQAIDDYIPHEKVSIVILVFNALPYVKKCIDSLVKYTSNYELIIIDNGSNAETKEYLAKKAQQLNFILQTNKKNMGFSYGCNQGIKLSTCDYICFLNSDTMVSINWLGKLMKGFDMPDAGIVGPSSCFCGGNQMIKRLITKRADMSQVDINSVRTGNDIVETEIYGFCYTVAKKVIDKIGVFDVARYPIGGAEEKDFSWRAGKVGFKSYWVQNSYVHHFGNKTFQAMGVKPIEPRLKNDKAFEKRKKDNNIYIRNKVHISKPVIPILMIVLDRYEYTKKALTALLENTNHPFKLFLFNNGSEGKTTRYLERLNDSRIEYFHSITNIGLVPAMNMFFDRFKDCRYVAKVDNDTVVHKDWLGKLKEVMDTYPLFTLQADHYLAMPFAIDTNEDFYKHCFGIEFKGSMLYFFKNSGGTGQLIRRDLIDQPMKPLSNTKGKGGLSGWCSMQIAKYKKYPSGFYTGVWIDRLDQVYTNKYKEVSDYPQYDEMIKKMRPWGLGYAKLPVSDLSKVKKELKDWFNKNDCGVC